MISHDQAAGSQNEILSLLVPVMFSPVSPSWVRYSAGVMCGSEDKGSRDWAEFPGINVLETRMNRNITAFFLSIAIVRLVTDLSASNAARISCRFSLQIAGSQNPASQTNGRGVIGMNCRTVPGGCRVTSLIKNGPADRAGIRPGDVILPLNAADKSSVSDQIAKQPGGTQIIVPFKRGNETTQVKVTLEDQLALALRSAALGDATAQNTLGNIYLQGRGVPISENEAFKWFLKAAENGFEIAQSQVGWMYFQGQGVKQDDRAAADWSRKAADQDDAAGQRLLGFLYLIGRGVSKDEKTAAVWLRKAALNGDPEAQAQFGIMCVNGTGVARDLPQGLEWLRTAAASGTALAEYDLGYVYENGIGVTKDSKTAIEWYQKAANHGYAPARQKLSELAK